MPTEQHKNTGIIFTIIGLCILLGIAGWYVYIEKIATSSTPEQIECQMDAKQCSDGSYVGRSGPKCEFEACPEVVPENTVTSTDQIIATSTTSTVITVDDISIVYPTTFDYTYLSAPNWPPTLAVSTEVYSCNTADDLTQERNLGEQTVCATVQSEGAAGSVYTTYTYSYTASKDRTATINFTIQAVQCMNYDMPEQVECQNEQDNFDINGLVSSMIRV